MKRCSGIVFSEALVEVFGETDVALLRDAFGLEEVDVHWTTHDEGRCGATAGSYSAPGTSIANHDVNGVGATKDTLLPKCNP